MDKVPAHLLRLSDIHQRFHRYVPRHEYLAGPSKPIPDALSHDFDLEWAALIDTLHPYLPPGSGHQVWHPSPKLVDAVLVALLQKRQDPENLLVVPPPASDTIAGPPPDKLDWPSMPTFKPSKLKHCVYVTFENKFVRLDLRSHAIPSSLGRLKVPYGHLLRRREVWGPRSDA